MARVLVTGANGFAGAALCRHLLARGWTVRGSVRRDDAVLPDGVEKIVTGALDGTTDWTAALAGVAAVVHCAARVHVLRETAADPPAAFRTVNVDASRRLAGQAAAAGVERFVFLSSIGAALAEAEPARASPYQHSKLAAEAALREAVQGSGMILVMLRPPLIYGPGAPGNFQRLARMVAAGRPLPLASLASKRSLLFIGNLATAVEAALGCAATPASALALSDGEDLSAAELARRIGLACGRPARLLPFPQGLLRLAGRLLGRRAAADALTGSLTVDNAAIRSTLGWAPAFTVDQGLAASLSRTAGPAAGPLGRAVAGGVFGSYALLGRLAAPLVRRYLRRRRARGKEDAHRLPERLGQPGLARPAGPLIWIHGASLGEAQSALPLIERLRRDWPGFAILMTSGTVTSARLMAERLPAGVIHQYVPVDLPSAVDGFLDHWHPEIGLIVESEFWPNLLRRAAGRGTRLVLLNGRVSPASYRGWRRVRPVIGELLSSFSLVLARAPEDYDHLVALGARQVSCPGDLKAAAPPLAADPAELARLESALAGRPRWLAASTHPGEERMVGETQRALRRRFPGLLTLLAPRHPHRAAEIRRELEDLGLTVAQRSRGEPIVPGIDVYLADGIGEMGLWYRLAEIVFVGGSLVPKGGQNLLEPAKLDGAILAGPHNSNFARLAAELAAAGGLRQVDSAAELTTAVGALLEQPATRAAMIAAARNYAAGQAGVLDRVMETLAPLLRESFPGAR